MTSPEAPFVHGLWITYFGTLLLAFALSAAGRIGRRACAVSQALCKAPLLDLVVACFTFLPWLIAGLIGGWAAFVGALAAQFIALWTWCAGHDLLHARAASGPRIVRFHESLVGGWRNEAALIVTLVALPIFWAIRILQLTLWWTLPLLLGFPQYRQGEWINVSRHKFDGLVGHDLVWCLYCDWMTGVYSLGAEMLRNVESFWCPIRFYDGKKCANCAVDFPDIDNGWVAADGNMHDVVEKMQQMYANGRREWFGHPARLTINGRAMPEPMAAEPAPAAIED